MKIHFLRLLTLLAISTPTFAADAAPAATAYPLATCVVSGEALDSMGETYVHIYKEEGKPDREVRLCCKGCLKKFNKSPVKYLEKLDAAQRPVAEKPSAADAHTGHDK